MKRKLWQKLMVGGLTCLSVGIGVVCVSWRLSKAELGPGLEMAAMQFAMPAGNLPDLPPEEKEPSRTEKPVPSETDQRLPSRDESSQTIPCFSEAETSGDDTGFRPDLPTEEEIAAYDREHAGETQYPVNEITITEGNVSFRQVQVLNRSSVDIDIEQELKQPLAFSLEDTDQPQVLIYHTHTSESYLPYDTGYFYESFYPRSSEPSQNVCAVGEEIVRRLNREGITAIHDTTIHDTSYRGAYDRSLATVQSYLEKYPTIKVVLDIHRDGIGTDTEKYKPVFLADGRKAAQMMILSGYNSDNDEEFDHWEENLRFALKLQEKAFQLYPEMARPLLFSDFMYNMHVNSGSLLIEIGAESNTTEEARYTGYLLGGLLADVLREEPQSAGEDAVDG